MKISFLDMTLEAQRRLLEPYRQCWGPFFRAEILDDGRLKIRATAAGRRWIRKEQNDPHHAIVDLDVEILLEGVGLELTTPSEVGALTDAPLCCLERTTKATSSSWGQFGAG